MHTGTEFELSPQKVYRQSSALRTRELLRFSILFVLCCVAILAILLASAPIVLKLIFLPLFALLACIMVWAYRWRTQVLLVTSPEGITYYSTSYRISTPWVNVGGMGMRIENTPEETRVTVTGLELRQPAPVFEVQPWLRFLLVDRPSFFIPISYVVRDWQHGEVAEDIRQYAPWVLREA